MTTIILTSTVNVHNSVTYMFQRDYKERIQSYLSSILNWLNKTQFNIVLVENSGYNFNELDEYKKIYKDRFEVIVFDETKLEEARFIQNSVPKGIHEIFAINYAFNNSTLLHSANFIIKITARFYIPEFEEYINNYDLNNYDCLVQNNRDRCEIVGSHIKYFSHIFDMNNIDDGHVEYLWNLRTNKYKNILICKIFEITHTQRGGENQKYSTM
jgi:hypothetical protein